MKWTLAVILVISLAAGLTHAYAVANNNRPVMCPRGQILIRGKCVTSASTIVHTTPTPTMRPVQSSSPQSQAQPQVAAPTCPLGQTMRNGKCSPKQCPAGMAVNAEGKCDCTTGFRKDASNRCVNEAALQNCRGGVLSKKGNCVMPTAAPTTVQKVCPKDHQLNDAGKCAPVANPVAARPCPSGQRKNRKGSCIPIVAGQSCGKDLWIDAQGNCGTVRVNEGCPEGKERNQIGNCVRIQVCMTGQVKDRTGVCQPQSCTANQQMKNGECVDIDTNRVSRG